MIEQDTIVVFNRRVALDTFLMGVRALSIAEAARPGQFVMIRAGEGLDPLLRRPFSICGVTGDQVMVLYRVVGRGTRMLSNTREGAFLSVLGPLGKGFAIPRSGQPATLVAGGMGIAPLAFLAGSIGAGRHLFLAGFGSADQIVRDHPMGLRDMEISFSTDDGSAGHPGLVTELLERALAHTDGSSLKVFACGPIPMLKAVAEITAVMNIPCQVSLEASMACGLGACQGCAVKAAPGQVRPYWHVCQDGPVFDRTDLDWEAL